MLGGIAQQRISQLVKEGLLVAERDVNGHLQIDRVSAEQLAARRALRYAQSAEDASEREMLQREARERFKRERERERDEERVRVEKRDALQKRGVEALEAIALYLKREIR